MINHSTNSEVREAIAALLLRQRGFVYELPHDEPVVFTMTGGIDSSLAALLTIELWNVTVYPLYVKRGATAEKYEIEAAQRVHAYLSRLYPQNIKEIQFVSVGIPCREIKDQLSRERIVQRGHPLRNIVLQSNAVQYATALNDQGVPVRTVLVGSVASDRFPGSHDTDLLVNTFALCQNLDEWQWQVLSPYFQSGLLKGKEKIAKKDLIQWGIEHSFPFEITRTCTSGASKSCGTCGACVTRLKTFSELHAKDPLSYS